MSLLLARRGTMGRATGTAPVGASPANVVLAKAIGSATGNSTSLAVALGSAPSAGRLLVVAAYGASATDLTVTGLTRVAFAVSGNVCTALFAKVTVGGETASQTVNATNSGVLRAEIMEWSPGAGVAWDTANLVATTGVVDGTGFSGTVVAENPTSGPSFAIAAFGVGAALFARTWTNGFDWDATVVDRFSAATKKSTSAETLSTTESWDTSRNYRGVLAAFRLV